MFTVAVLLLVAICLIRNFCLVDPASSLG